MLLLVSLHVSLKSYEKSNNSNVIFKYLGMHLKHIVVPEMVKDQVVSGWTMFGVLDPKQELKSVYIMAGDRTIVAIPKIYQSIA